MDSKADKPCRYPVLTIKRTAANKSRPQSDRNPLVIFLNITFQRIAYSLELFDNTLSLLSDKTADA